MSVIHTKETDSTSNYLKELALRQQLEEGTIVFTDFQTAGKGQRGNSWESEKEKNLLFSIILYPVQVRANEQFILSQIISLAIADLLSNYTGDITVKWPNDIYWKDKKICGILLENTLQGEKISQSVIGIGININQQQFLSDAPNPVSLTQITGKEYLLNDLLKEAQANIFYYYSKLESGDIESIVRHYKNSLFRREGFHLYNDGFGNFSAQIKDIEPNGILVLETLDRVERKFAFKEVKYILSEN